MSNSPRAALHAAVAAVALLHWSVASGAVARVTLRGTGAGERTVESAISESTTLVSLASLAESFGFSCRWDPVSRILTISSGSRSLAFTQDLPFYSVGDSVRQLPAPPRRQGQRLMLQASAAAEAFGRLCPAGLSWNAAAGVMEPRAPEVTAPAVARGSAPEEPADGSAASVRGRQDGIGTIVIDPGHGGHDPGAIGPGGTREKDISLAIALHLRDLLKKKSRLTVFMTRDKDVFIPLEDRTRFANEKKAQVFVSIHANSIAGPKARTNGTRGYKVYFLSQAKNEEDKLAAMRENAVVELEHSPKDVASLQSIIVEILNNEYLTESQDLSIIIDQTFASALKDRIGKLHLGVGQAPFWVLNGAYMPAVLVETGFISHPEEEKLLADPDTQRKVAEALHSAIASFVRKLEAMQ